MKSIARIIFVTVGLFTMAAVQSASEQSFVEKNKGKIIVATAVVGTVGYLYFTNRLNMESAKAGFNWVKGFFCSEASKEEAIKLIEGATTKLI